MLGGKTIRILSIDGGGTRGYLSTAFLRRFCDQWGVAPERLYEKFDLICGASTGGILATCYAVGRTPEEMMDFYREEAPWIFTIRTAADVMSGSHDASEPSNRPNLAQKLAMIAANDPFYKAAYDDSNYGDVRLKRKAEELFGDGMLTALRTNVLLTAYDVTTETPVMISNIDNPDYVRDMSCVDAVMCTSAAPMYLPKRTIVNPLTEESVDYIDGGIFQLNPAALGYVSARRLFPYANRYCVLSLGTGKEVSPPKDAYSDRAALEVKVLSEYRKITDHLKTPEEKEQAVSRALGDSNDLGDEIKELISLIDREMTAGQIAGHKFFDMLSGVEDINLFYYRFDAPLAPEKDTELDNSTEEFFDYLDEVVNDQYERDAAKIGSFIGRLSDDYGGIG